MPVYEIPAQEFNIRLAAKLKELPEFKMPDWALFVKTGAAKTKPPVENEWWHKRAASILRQIYIKRVVGVNRLRVRYGSRKNRGMKPEKFARAGGKIIRIILQQAETAGFLEKVGEGKKRGRKLTQKGKEFLDSIQTSRKSKENTEKAQTKAGKAETSEEQNKRTSKESKEIPENKSDKEAEK